MGGSDGAAPARVRSVEDRAASREFPFSDSEFAFIRELVEQHAAIKLPDTKRQMVYGRLVRRLRELPSQSMWRCCVRMRAAPSSSI